MSEIKIVLIGEKDVGKSCLLYQYDDKTFYEDLLMTTMGDILIKTLNIDNKKIKIEIIDTPGNPLFRSIIKLFIKGAHIFLLIFDLTDIYSFNQLNDWYNIAISNNNKENILFAVVGNKNDLYEKRIISENEGNKFAKQINGIYFETSALDYESVEKLFQTIVLTYIKTVKEGKLLKDFDNKLNDNEENEMNNEEKYYGDIINGKKEGKGKMIYKNGDYYNGNWKNNLREGKGTFINKKGDKYYGIWKNDILENNVTIKYKNGDEFEGIIKYGKKEGEGKIIYKDLNVIYIGNWENDQKNGFGKLIFKNKVINLDFKEKKEYDIFERYEGNFKNDIIEGEGTFFYKDGKIIIGNFKNNEPINGKIIYPNGQFFEGYFINEGLKNGKGFLYNNENDYKIFKENLNIINKDILEIFNLKIENNFYYGNFENDNKSGKGILYMKNMFDNYDDFVLYEGNFKNDLKNRNGTIYFNDKSSLYAEWKNDEIKIKKNGVFKFYDINLEFTYKFGLKDWIDFIKNKQKDYYGNREKNIFNKDTIR